MAGLRAMRQLRSGTDAAAAGVLAPRPAANADDALMQVFGFLWPEELGRCAAVAKRWRRISGLRDLWHFVFSSVYPRAYTAGFDGRHSDAHDWRTLAVLTHTGLQRGFELPMPDVPEAKEGDPEDKYADTAFVASLVPVAEEWVHLLRCARDQQAQKTVIRPGTTRAFGPLAEIDYWDEQLRCLQQLADQLDSPVALYVRDILLLSDTRPGEDLDRLSKDARRLKTEASWNAKYFKILRSPFAKLAEGDASALPVIVPGMVRTLHMVWTSSRFYNTRRRMEPLLGRVSAAIAARVVESVDLSALLRDAVHHDAFTRSDALQQLEDCFSSVDKWLAAFLGFCGAAGKELLADIAEAKGGGNGTAGVGSGGDGGGGGGGSSASGGFADDADDVRSLASRSSARSLRSVHSAGGDEMGAGRRFSGGSLGTPRSPGRSSGAAASASAGGGSTSAETWEVFDLKAITGRCVYMTRRYGELRALATAMGDIASRVYAGRGGGGAAAEAADSTDLARRIGSVVEALCDRLEGPAAGSRSAHVRSSSARPPPSGDEGGPAAAGSGGGTDAAATGATEPRPPPGRASGASPARRGRTSAASAGSAVGPSDSSLGGSGATSVARVDPFDPRPQARAMWASVYSDVVEQVAALSSAAGDDSDGSGDGAEHHK